MERGDPIERRSAVIPDPPLFRQLGHREQLVLDHAQVTVIDRVSGTDAPAGRRPDRIHRRTVSGFLPGRSAASATVNTQKIVRQAPDPRPDVLGSHRFAPIAEHLDDSLQHPAWPVRPLTASHDRPSRSAARPHGAVSRPDGPTTLPSAPTLSVDGL